MSKIMYIEYVWYAKWVESIMMVDLRGPNNIFAASK